MTIPIFNTLYNDSDKKIISKNISIKELNNLSFENVKVSKYPMIKLLSHLQKKLSLYETVIVSTNDILVDLFLKNTFPLLKLLKYYSK